jgi:hypothetical protein
MELAEGLVFISVFGRNFVREPEEEKSEGFSWNKVEMGLFDTMFTRFSLLGLEQGMGDSFHLFELMYNM